MQRAINLPRLGAEFPLLGRERALHEMGARLARTLTSHGESVLVAGESGVGKTRIAQEVARMAAARGFSVAQASANAIERDVSYSLVNDMLGPLVAALGAAKVNAMTRGRASALATVFPAVSADAGAVADGDPGEIKARAFWTCGQLLARMGATQPLLLIADNLQWADAPSIELLHYIARGCREWRVMLLATWTTDESSATGAWSAVQRSVTSLGITEIVRLGPLSRDEICDLVSEVFDTPRRVVAEFASLLYGWTRGNPLFAREILRELVESGALYRCDGSWHGWDVSNLVLPATLRDTLHGRIAALSECAREIATTVAASGAGLAHDVLVRIGVHDDSMLLAALDELRRGMIIEERAAAGSARYDVSHPLMREVILADAGIVRVQRAHGSLAAALAAGSSSHRATPEDVANHVLLAGAAADQHDWLPVLVEAGERSLARHAATDAVKYLAAAHANLRADDAALRTRVTTALARARQRNGEYAAAAVALVRIAR